MDMLVIQGGQPLRGTVRVSGAKNAALPIMTATLAVSGRTRLFDVPDLRDTRSMISLLTQLGMQVSRAEDNSLLLEAQNVSEITADYDLVRTMRASVCVLGPLLAARKAACVSLPGGCNIGHRPIDLHLKGLAALGAEIEIQNGYVLAKADQLRGARIFLGGPQGSTVTGTCNVLSAAVLAKGITVIEAAACEPEVVDLGHFLNRCGAKISGLGTPRLEIEGVERLQAIEHRIIPDRIESGTWMIAAAVQGDGVFVERARAEDSPALLDLFEQMAIPFHCTEAGIQIDPPGKLTCRDVVALPYPGFPTDLQAQITALLAVSSGVSVVTDRVFPDRFMHASELMRMGAKIRREGNSAVIEGVNGFSGANVMASDLRASAALVIAALAATGESTIRRIYHLDRGYERLDEKLRELGASITRIPEN